MAARQYTTDPQALMKACSRCPEKGLQPREAFYKDAQKRDGLSSQCRRCIDARMLLYRGTPSQKAAAHRWATSAKCRAKRPSYNARRPLAASRAVKRASEARRRARKRGLPGGYSTHDEQFARNYWHDACAVCGDHAGFWKSIVLDHWIPLSSPDCPGSVLGNMVPLCHARQGIRHAIPDCNVSKWGHDPMTWLTEKLGTRQAARKAAEIQRFFQVAIAYAHGDEASGVA